MWVFTGADLLGRLWLDAQVTAMGRACYVMKGDILGKDLKRFEQAAVEYTKAIELQPGSAALFEKRAKALRENGDTEKTLADEQDASRLRVDEILSKRTEKQIENED